MNAVEIEQAITDLAEKPFDPIEFPYFFLEAFGNKETTIKRLRNGASNRSDVGGVLQTNNIHILTCAVGGIPKALKSLRDSPATEKAKAKFILATDGVDFDTENLENGDTLACTFRGFPDHFAFFLPLAGISTVRQITENAFDIRATSRLNRLYVELLKDNPEWGKGERRHDMNHFMARLIFCFFAEDTSIFVGKGKFTETIEQMSAKDSSNTHEVIATLFRAMNTKSEDRTTAKIPRWAEGFPYVNGGLFAGSLDVPRFSKIARSYLLHVGSLDWTKINPDIFGSMIQAVADEEERGELGMHYTSVPNILKVLNPLFLDDLRAKLQEAVDNPRILLHLRKRISRIRVFDPACGSGNFLVIAYKELRALEAEINKRRGEPNRRSDIPITNFRGIELRDFPAEIARLALIIAEYQCDALYRGQKPALDEFLPLRTENWIVCGNSLRLDWLSICPPTGTAVKVRADDLLSNPSNQSEISFNNDDGETYICGNPPYQGSVNQTNLQKEDIDHIFSRYLKSYKDLDYVACWIVRAAEYAHSRSVSAAFVTTNSICQGEQVGMLWPIIFGLGLQILFAHTSFIWKNNAANNAGVTCIVIGITTNPIKNAILFTGESAHIVSSIGPYLVPSSSTIVKKSNYQISGLPEMVSGNKATDDGNLILSREQMNELLNTFPNALYFIKRLEGAKEFIRGESRWCIWVTDADVARAAAIPAFATRFERIRESRSASRGKQANDAASYPHRFVFAPHTTGMSILVPSVSSERREYLPCGWFDEHTVIVAPNLAMYGAPMWCLALIASRLHLVWIATVCGKLKTDFRYSNTLGWNTFPVPILTNKNINELTRCAENILLAREKHFPATIANLYNPDHMPSDLRAAHDHNDETIERIYIGRLFKNDTERLEKLFELYTKTTHSKNPSLVKTSKR
jgi:hypothetical protein